MERVPWATYDGNDVEAVVAMMICLEHPDAYRIRPARGDEGIDILVPAPDGSVEVYQVKKFASSMTASQWRQVKKSYQRVQKSKWLAGRKVTKWHLTMPLDATTGDSDKFDEITAGAPWAVRWKGLAFIEALASKYPTVIDYYLGNGRARLDVSVQRLTDLVADRARPDGAPLSAAEARQTLTSLFNVLNSNDPFYVYGLAISPRPPAAGSLDEPGLVAAVVSGDGASGYVTVKVIARCAESTLERPVPLQMTIDLDAVPGMREQVKEFEKYGVTLSLPAGAVKGSVDVPGGLGGDLEGFAVEISPSFDLSEMPDLRLQVRDASDVVVAECSMKKAERSEGPARTGVRTVHRSPSQVLELELRFDLQHHRATCRVRGGDVTGSVPTDAFGALNVLRAAHDPSNHLRISLPYGPQTSGVDFPAPSDVSEVGLDAVIDLAGALMDVQGITTQRIVMPDPSHVTMKELDRLRRLAALARGETIRRRMPAGGVLTFAPESEGIPEVGVYTLTDDAPLSVSLDGQELHLGHQERSLVAVRIVPGSRRVFDDRIEVDFVPTDASEITLRHVAEAGQVSMSLDGP